MAVALRVIIFTASHGQCGVDIVIATNANTPFSYTENQQPFYLALRIGRTARNVLHIRQALPRSDELTADTAAS